MQKTILITGATDGIGFATAKRLADTGHRVLMHGRDREKLTRCRAAVGGNTVGYIADLSCLQQVRGLAGRVLDEYPELDVLINNAGVFPVENPLAPNGLDVRFVVNTIAPYLLTTILLPSMPDVGRVVNVASAAMRSVDIDALAGDVQLHNMAAYAQSKLALVMWTIEMANNLPSAAPAILAVNPSGPVLATKMVTEGLKMRGSDVGIGADAVCNAALSPEFTNRSGQFYDNDIKDFRVPHPDVLDMDKVADVSAVIRFLTRH